MIRAMVSGTLYGVPQARTAASGKQYATAKLRADGKDGTSVWCSFIAFGDIADRLLTLADGAALSISGRAEVNAWLDKAGEPKAGLSLVADEMVTLKGKPRPAPVEAQGQERTGQYPPRPPRRPPCPDLDARVGFDDALPDFM